MEMCYDGALVMPKNYAVVNEEEMTYVEGGIAIINGLVGGAINLAISAILAGIGGFSTKLANAGLAHIVKIAGRGAAKATLEKYIKRVAGAYIASWVCGWIPSILTLFGYILDPGPAIAKWLDSKDKKPNNGYLNL